jgi:mitochondrial fission protein ELM1
VTDGAAGNERQAHALAQAMQIEARTLRTGLRGPWAWFAPRLTAGLRIGVDADLRRRLHEPWPALVIGCGRDGATLARWLRTASGGKTFTVQILDPRIDPKHFDLVVAPRHDALEGANVIQSLGALNPVDDAWLAQGLAHFPMLAQLPQPRAAVLIGGPRRGLDMSDAWFESFLAHVNALATRDGGSLMVSTSRRTPAAWRRLSRERLRADCVHFWNGPEDGDNPYQGYLAAADRIAVTPDSVNMLSEACATHAPVFALGGERLDGRPRGFLERLRETGRVRDADSGLEPFAVEPLRETARVADIVRERLDL